MRVSVARARPTEVEADALAVSLFEGESPGSADLAELDRAAGGAVSRAIDLGDFRGKLHETFVIHPPGGKPARRVLLVGAGAEKDCLAERVRTLAGTAVRALHKRGRIGRVALWLRSGLEPSSHYRVAAEGAVLAAFDTGALKTGKARDELDRRGVEEVWLLEPDEARAATAERAVGRGVIVAEAQNYARALVNTPGNRLYPLDLAGEARKLADLGMEVEVLEQEQLEALGAGGILAAGGGSVHPPALAAIRYRGHGDGPFLGLIGKGVTFDTGGISIKPAEHMNEMRTDMAGAAAVLGAMRAIGQLRPRANVLGVIPAVENMPGGRAYRPGDVITTLGGKTVEVLSTDAEGRVVLADAIAYAQRHGANRLVDAATLTGAIVVALGDAATGIMGTPQEWVDRVMAAARSAGERVWQLPLLDEYRERIDSDLADVANSGGRQAGAITAALFIREFVDDGVAWAHLDIAGTDSAAKETPYLAKGGLGTGVRTFVDLVMGDLTSNTA